MNWLRKYLNLVVVLVLLAGFSIGCGAGPEEAEPTSPPEEAETEETGAEEEEEAEVIELDIFHFYSEGAGVQPELVEQGEKFMEENPQYTIKWTWGGSEAMQKLRARINAGDPPDIALQNDANISVLAREGVAVPVDEYLETDNYEGDATWKDTFWPGPLQNGFVSDATKGPGYYGIPWTTHVSGIYYNVGMFEENGYDIPQTWNDLFALCERIQNELDIPCFAADNFVNYNARPHFYIITRMIGHEKLYSTALNEEGASWEGTPEFEDAATMAQKLFTDYVVQGWEGNQWPTGQVDWANGGAAMIFMPTWLPSELRDSAPEGFEMNIFPVPYIEGAEGDPEIAEMKFNGWFVPDGAEHPDEAIEFAKFLTSNYAQTMNMETGNLPPAIKGVDLPPGVEGAQEMLEGYGAARFGFGLDADAAEWQKKVFFPLNDQLLAGMLTPEEFIGELQDAHDEFYAGRTEEEVPEAVQVPEPAEVDVFHFYSEGAGVQPELTALAKEFEEENPGYSVKWTWGGSEAMQKLRARINAGDPPDIAIQNDANIAVFAREGVAAPLDDYLAGVNYEGDGIWKETFWPGVLENGFIEDAEMGAHYYGIPDNTHVSGIYYNVGMFEEYGYETPDTWEALWSLCDTIQEEQGIPCFSADNFVNYNARPHFYIITRLIGHETLYNTALNKEETSWAGTPEFEEAAAMAQRLFTDYVVQGWEGNQWPTGQVDWANGGAAMIFMPTWLPSELRDAKAEDFEMNIFPVPYIEGAEGDPQVAEMKFNGWFVPDGAANPDQGIYFAKFLTSRHVQRVKMEEANMPPAIKRIPLPPGVEGAQEMLEGFGAARFGFGLDADAAEWQKKVFFPLNDQLLAGTLTPEEFIQQLQEAHDQFYGN